MDGPFTYLDLALITGSFVSGLFAMHRGFVRELLSIISWISAVGVGYWVFAAKKDMTADIAAQTDLPPQIAAGAVVVAVAIIVLIVVHLTAARISDAILDSQVGIIDRILGFIFGVLRGLLLFVIPYMAYEAFISPEKENQHSFLRDAFFSPYIRATSESIWNILLQVSSQPPATLPPSSSNEQPRQQDLL